MKIGNYQFPKSSFLSVDKDMSIITDYLLKNDRLKKLLHYTSKDCLDRVPLTEDESLELFGKNIKIVPKLYIDDEVLNYIIISFDNFTQNRTNPEFRDNIIEFDIICHYDQCHLKDFQLRPYKIAAEIDSMIDGQKLTGIGQMEFLGANQMLLTDEYAGLCLLYRAVHGEEDRKKAPNQVDDNDIVENFNQIFN